MMWPEFGGSGKLSLPRDSNGCRKETRLRFRSKQSRQHPLLQRRSLAAEEWAPHSTSSNDRGHFVESWDGRHWEPRRFLTTLYCRRPLVCTHHGTLVQSLDGDGRDPELWDVPSQREVGSVLEAKCMATEGADGRCRIWRGCKKILGTRYWKYIRI